VFFEKADGKSACGVWLVLKTYAKLDVFSKLSIERMDVVVGLSARVHI
jgi:hypothetical protein